MTDKTGKYLVFCSGQAHMKWVFSHAKAWFGQTDPQMHVYSAYSADPETSRAYEAFVKTTATTSSCCSDNLKSCLSTMWDAYYAAAEAYYAQHGDLLIPGQVAPVWACGYTIRNGIGRTASCTIRNAMSGWRRLECLRAEQIMMQAWRISQTIADSREASAAVMTLQG